jgi:hypothetical protein
MARELDAGLPPVSRGGRGPHQRRRMRDRTGWSPNPVPGRVHSSERVVGKRRRAGQHPRERASRTHGSPSADQR